jgi:CheY-like chemotaxis protein
MMQCNYRSISEASLILPLIGRRRQFFQTQVPNYFLPPSQNRQTRAPEFAGTSPTKNEGKTLALVVDDLADVTEMLSVFLTLAGYKVVTENSALAAFAAAQSTQFDVIISDIGMPEMNGYELAQTLRALPGYNDVPMIAVTGFSMVDDRERSLRSGFNAHLTKPIDPNFLFELIERLRG